MKTVLAPIDFSPVSRLVVAEATRLAAALQARVVLLHSVPPPPIVATDVAPMVDPALYLTDDLQKAATRRLTRMVRDAKERGLRMETISTTGFPVVRILEQARKLGADYIVLGSHGHTAFYDLVIGGTASGVLKRAACPVLVVPARRKGKTRPKRRT